MALSSRAPPPGDRESSAYRALSSPNRGSRLSDAPRRPLNKFAAIARRKASRRCVRRQRPSSSARSNDRPRSPRLSSRCLGRADARASPPTAFPPPRARRKPRTCPIWRRTAHRGRASRKPLRPGGRTGTAASSMRTPTETMRHFIQRRRQAAVAGIRASGGSTRRRLRP